MAEKRKSVYEIDMCTGAILPKLLQFTLPLMFSGMLQLLFNAADVIVVGRWAGDNSLAAVSSNTSMVALLTNFFIGLSTGTNILAARYFGSKDRDSLRSAAGTAILLSLICGVLLTAAGVTCAGTILVWMKTPAEVLGLASLYLRIYFLGMPVVMLYNFGAALLRAVGDTRRPLYYLLGAGVINVLLNLFFVIVCRLDVAGVALATILSQAVSALLVLRCLFHGGGLLCLERKDLRISRPQLRQILRLGLPAGIQATLFSLSNVVIQSSVNSFGNITMAGNGAADNIETLAYAAINAFFQANISFTSQNLGAGRIDRLRPILVRFQLCVLCVGVLLGGGSYLLGPQLLGIYTQSPAVIEAGMIRMRMVGAIVAGCGVMDVMGASVRGMGYSLLPMVVTLVGVCGFRLAWIATVFQIPQYHTIEMVYLSYPISWTITAVTHLVCFLWALRRLQRLQARQGTPQEEPTA